MKNLPPSVLIALSVLLGVIALVLLIALFPSTRSSQTLETSQTGTTLENDGVLRGTDSFNLPGSPYYGDVTPPSRRYEPTQLPADPGIVCTQEAMLCPDGSYVGRTGPNCAFATCPGQ